jgi:hypothetical protein
MAKFAVVKEAPTTLNEGDYVINKPDFLAEIESQKRKAGRQKITGLTHLRMILDAIAQNYDPQNMTAYSVRANLFEGRPYESDQDLNVIVNEMLRKDYPSIYLKYLDKKIKSRPKDTQLVYYVDSNIDGAEELFIKNGLDELVEEKVDKPKRVVGKPAVTKEQAELLKQKTE